MLNVFRPQQQENWEERLKYHQANTFLVKIKNGANVV